MDFDFPGVRNQEKRPKFLSKEIEGKFYQENADFITFPKKKGEENGNISEEDGEVCSKLGFGRN